MAILTVNIGTSANKGDGDPLRVAFDKINKNFAELDVTNKNRDINGSVFADDSTLLIDAVNGTISASALSGSLPAIDGGNLTGVLSNLVEDTTPQLGGVLDTNGNNVTFADSVNAEFGNDQDLKIFHNGTHSLIRETGTGSLYLQSDNNVILSTHSGTEVMVKGTANGATELYHNGILKLNTSTSGVTIVDELHTEGATPHLTLKRTNNANVATLRFKGSGGTVGASIDFDGTGGTSNELAFQTFDGVSLAERFRVTYTGVTVTGTLNGHTIPAGAGTIALLTTAIPLATLKTEVAASTDFADFKSRIAAL